MNSTMCAHAATLDFFLTRLDSLPVSTSWYLSDLGEAKGLQDLYLRQYPQVLRTLRQFAIIESSISSNRIEGVHIAKDRVAPLLVGNAPIGDRDEEEVHGYKQALELIYEGSPSRVLDEQFIKTLHRKIRGDIWDSGSYKDRNSDIIERFSDGRERIRFRTVPAAQTTEAMQRLMSDYDHCIRERRVHPLLVYAAFNLDFLCIHPFRDGNGRVSRLLLVSMLLSGGYEVGRFISLERLIEENKERYYETLEQSSRGWHEGVHDPWPYLNYILFIVKTAYKELTLRSVAGKPVRGEKHGHILEAFAELPDTFAMADLIAACPGISPETVRKAVKELKREGKVMVEGAGRYALWRKCGIPS